MCICMYACVCMGEVCTCVGMLCMCIYLWVCVCLYVLRLSWIQPEFNSCNHAKAFMGHLPCKKTWCQDRKFIELGVFLQGPWWYGLGIGLALAFKHIFLWWLQCLYLTSVQNLKVSSFVSKTSLLWGSWRIHAVWTHSLSILKMWHFRKLIYVAKVLIWKSGEASRPFHCPIPWSLLAPRLLSATLDLLCPKGKGDSVFKSFKALVSSVFKVLKITQIVAISYPNSLF